MSTYTCFFIRHKDEFIPIGSYGRNCSVARAFNDSYVMVPWEKVSPLTEKEIGDVINYVIEQKKEDKERIAEYNADIAMVKSIDAPLNEKLEKIYDIQEFIKEVEEDYNEWEYAHSYLSFLLGIIDEAKWAEDESKKVDIDNYIYFGLEISYPTIEDVVEMKGE